MKHMEILNSLEQGKITAEKAISLLNKCKKAEHKHEIKKSKKRRKGHWFKIHIKDKDTNLKFYVPVSIINLGFSMARFAAGSKYLSNNKGMEVAQKVLKSIDKNDIKCLTKEIKACGKTDLVQVVDGDTFVTIRVI
jgi:hypothetical protein